MGLKTAKEEEEGEEEGEEENKTNFSAYPVPSKENGFFS